MLPALAGVTRSENCLGQIVLIPPVDRMLALTDPI